MTSALWARAGPSERGWSVPQVIVFSVLMLTYAAVFVYTMRCLLRPHARIANRLSLLLVTIFLFLTTLAMYGIFLAGWQPSSFRVVLSETRTLSIVWTILFAVNIVVGDAVLAWRACVIWRWKKAVKITSMFLLFAVAALWTFAIIIGTIAPSIPPSLVMSAWSTGAVAWRTWQQRRLFLSNIFRIGNSRVQTFEDILAALVELGAVYTVLWIAFLITTYTAADPFLKWIEIIMIVAVGLYPTLTVVLVARHKTPLADQLTGIEALDGSDVDLAFDAKWEDRSL
ncbi:unnamed protein product [Peniophora sp. CBMAI 1063]|nr:unnamed protein product [Peniophora sp. CBMAI 1063]